MNIPAVEFDETPNDIPHLLEISEISFKLLLRGSKLACLHLITMLKEDTDSGFICQNQIYFNCPSVANSALMDQLLLFRFPKFLGPAGRKVLDWVPSFDARDSRKRTSAVVVVVAVNLVPEMYLNYAFGQFDRLFNDNRNI